MPQLLFDFALPIVASTDTFALASALDRAADAALFLGRIAYAEHLACRAAELREQEAGR